ncbi:MAG: phospho-N-acetylmuramoyl-pentapeptide-transferase [Oscillospiraceae bacterium]|jgi:phospho-N-acetylmuramoyl-pentapeptide-transferase
MPFWVNIIVSFIAFGITALSGLILIPFLRKIKCGQTILDIGPKWHKGKQGTPTMGGFMFIAGITAAVLFGYAYLRTKGINSSVGWTDTASLKLFTGLIMALLFMAVGFLDDYIKVVKKRNLGLRAKQKLLFQVLISGGYLYLMNLLGEKSTSVYLPVIGDVNFGLLYYPLMVLFIIFIVNSVNLTDGIDGLCGSVTVIASLSYLMIFVLLENWEYSVYAIAIAGGCLGFLLWNLNPAKVFMGDTGSMFLGGSIAALGFATGYHIIIITVGIIYVCESLSVILQVISFKTTGKRIFKMSPIHHHFEMSGWGEYKIVIVFSFVTLIAGSLSVFYVYQLISNTIVLK